MKAAFNLVPETPANEFERQGGSERDLIQ